jgi:hypothetical protein
MIHLILLAALFQFDYVMLEKPCRVIDTRVKTKTMCHDFDYNGQYDDWECMTGVPQNGALQFILAGDSSRVGVKSRGYAEAKEFNIGDQGGENPDGCGVPRDAKAVRFMIVVLPQYRRQGHIRIRPFSITGYHPWNGAPLLAKPYSTSVLNWSSSDEVESAWLDTLICDPETANFGDCNEDISISAYGSPVGVVIDIAGYYH